VRVYAVRVNDPRLKSNGWLHLCPQPFHLAHYDPGKYPDSQKKNLPAYSVSAPRCGRPSSLARVGCHPLVWIRQFGSTARPGFPTHKSETAEIDFLPANGTATESRSPGDVVRKTSPRYSFNKSPRYLGPHDVACVFLCRSQLVFFSLCRLFHWHPLGHRQGPPQEVLHVEVTVWSSHPTWGVVSRLLRPFQHVGVGKSVVSTATRAPAYGFGSSGRETIVIPASSKTGLSSTMKSSTAMEATANTTVLDAKTATSLGKMVESTRPSCPSYGFGTTPR
jgi:hypothetical protein